MIGEISRGQLMMRKTKHLGRVFGLASAVLVLTAPAVAATSNEGDHARSTLSTSTDAGSPPQPVNGKCPKGWTYEVPPPHRDPHTGLPTGKHEHKPEGWCVRSK